MNSRSVKLVTLTLITVAVALLCSCSDALCPTYLEKESFDYVKIVQPSRIEMPYTDKYRISIQKKYTRSRKRLLSSDNYHIPSQPGAILFI